MKIASKRSLFVIGAVPAAFAAMIYYDDWHEQKRNDRGMLGYLVAEICGPCSDTRVAKNCPARSRLKIERAPLMPGYWREMALFVTNTKAHRLRLPGRWLS
jgi:hypothetical protein